MSKINIGDNVKFLNDIGGGKVVNFIDKETAMIMTSDGFEMPVMIRELLKTEEEQDFFSTSKKSNHKKEEEKQPEKKQDAKKTEVIEEDIDDEPYVKETDEINLYLAFVPKDMKAKTDCDMDVFLINDSNYHIMYNLQRKNENFYNSRPGKLAANTKEQIDTFKRQDIVNLEELYFQFIFFKNSLHEYKKPLERQLKITNTKFYKQGSFCENDFFDEDALVLTIYEENAMEEAVDNLKIEELKKVIVDKEVVNAKINKPKQYQQNIQNMQVEVDLHIHELIDDQTGLTPSEIIEIQLDTFRHELDEAIKNPKINKIVFIHGIGNGTLKTELRRELERSYRKYKFQDASFKEYGYGATLVHV